MGAKHGWWCNANTVKMTCKYCGETIYWFSCDCGSSKIFEELGDPWPEHFCPGYYNGQFAFQNARKKKKKRDKYGMTKKDWKRLPSSVTKQEAKTELGPSNKAQRKQLRRFWKFLYKYENDSL